MEGNKKSEPLTLEKLAEYNQEVLFPMLEERFSQFATKKELQELKNEFHDLKDDFFSYKDKSMSYFDSIMRKLDILLEQKEVNNYRRRIDERKWHFLSKKLESRRIVTRTEANFLKS